MISMRPDSGRNRPTWPRWLLVLLVVAGMTSACQFVQNEFVTLDVARPAPIEPLD